MSHFVWDFFVFVFVFFLFPDSTYERKLFLAWFNLFKMRKKKGTSLEGKCVVLALIIKKGMVF